MLQLSYSVNYSKRSVIYNSGYRGWARFGEGMETFTRTLGGYETLWRIFQVYEIL